MNDLTKDSVQLPEDLTALKPVRRTERHRQGEKLRNADKVERIPVKVIASDAVQRKPDWLRIRISSSPEVERIKGILRKNNLVTVCEEASCPNLSECFSGGTATFMIMGDKCTRRCPFCDVAHGKPKPLDENEPSELASRAAGQFIDQIILSRA